MGLLTISMAICTEEIWQSVVISEDCCRHDGSQMAERPRLQAPRRRRRPAISAAAAKYNPTHILLERGHYPLMILMTSNGIALFSGCAHTISIAISDDGPAFIYLLANNSFGKTFEAFTLTHCDSRQIERNVQDHQLLSVCSIFGCFHRIVNS